jgi:hypothetical protein
MNESPPKRKKERNENIHTTNFDCDKEPKIKGCQQSEPESPDGFYMKFMKNQRNRSPYARLPKLPCCENLFKQALFVVVENKSHHHTFVLRAVKIILCGNVA